MRTVILKIVLFWLYYELLLELYDFLPISFRVVLLARGSSQDCSYASRMRVILEDVCKIDWYKTTTGFILWMHPANERRRYVVTSPLIGWAHAQKDLCINRIQPSANHVHMSVDIHREVFLPNSILNCTKSLKRARYKSKLIKRNYGSS